MNTEKKITRLMQLWRILRDRENEAARAGNYALACTYYRATFRASCLIVALHFQDGKRHQRFALEHNQYLAKRAPMLEEI